ncbi:myb-like protein X isoform X2 [Gigantopelta aegis]|uniref:myb-like protein X isoform X2 n=1 Tax=Gigantopelta aegis TaxID=1735272 RepID=UPI001B889529|nr:myb-like protein X isoform X2 [Gigantopelta aegis]
MTFTSRDVKDVADLVARKLEIYMNLERRESRFKPEGYYRTTPKMEEYDLLFRVDDSLAKNDKTRLLLASGGKGHHNRSPGGPKAKKSKALAGQKKKGGTEKKTSKTKDSSKKTESETVHDEAEPSESHGLVVANGDAESERGKNEENCKSEDGAIELKEETKDHTHYNRERDKETTGQKADDDVGKDGEAKDEMSDNPGTDKKSKDQSGNTKTKGKGSQKENRISQKQKRKKKPLINPKLTDPALHVVPIREVGRLTSFANNLFSEQPIEKLHVIHRYRPNSDDIPHLTENGRVQNYTDHVGAALHSVKYIDYYLKQGLQTGKKEYSKRLQELKPAKVTEKSEETHSDNRAVMSDGKRNKTSSQRNKKTLSQEKNCSDYS